MVMLVTVEQAKVFDALTAFVFNTSAAAGSFTEDPANW